MIRRYNDMKEDQMIHRHNDMKEDQMIRRYSDMKEDQMIRRYSDMKEEQMIRRHNDMKENQMIHSHSDRQNDMHNAHGQAEKMNCFFKIVYRMVMLVCLTALCTGMFGVSLSVNRAQAAQKWIVDTDSLNVRTGAGTSFSLLNDGGADVKLQRGSAVTVLEEVTGGWCRVSFTYNGAKKEGYVASMYLKKKTDKSILAENLTIPATMTLKKQISKKPKKNSKALTYNGKAVKLKKGTKLVVRSIRKKSGLRWYEISFDYKKNQLEGYILSSYVQIGKGMYKANVVTKTKVYKKAGKKTVYKIKKKAVSLKQGKSIKILKEKTAGKAKWFYVRFIYKGKKVKAWLKADSVMFVSPKKAKKPASTGKPAATAAPLQNVPLSDAEFEADMTSQGFPESYKPMLRQLHSSYPYWQFKIYNTGIDWNTALAEESKNGVSLIPNSKAAGWKSYAEGAYDYMNDKYIVYDGTAWVCASKDAVAYYMDPRNFLNSKNIFMFEALTYESSYQTTENVEKILNGTLFGGNSFTYTDDTGSAQTKTYAQTFIEAAATNNISPVHLASRVKQEVVTGSKTVSNAVTGTVSGYEGIYNFYNIGASDSATGQAYLKGLKFASVGTTYMRPWNNQYKAIVGGAQYIAGNYVKRGQNTLYLQRFNVTPNSTFNHQYMTNVEAVSSESAKIQTAYSQWMATTPYVFYIPVYRNMPENPAPAPTGTGNPNNYLKTLDVKGNTTGISYTASTPFNPADGGKNELIYYVPASENSVTISGTTVNSGAAIYGTGQVSLVIAPVKINVTVTAENGEVRNYVVTINKM